MLRVSDGRRFDDYGTALSWTAMLQTTMGSEYWPRTTEVQVPCVLMTLDAFAVFGNVTRGPHLIFAGRDADSGR